MERVQLAELPMHTRTEVLTFLKRLWHQETTDCPFCGKPLELLHRKAKKSDCDWKCTSCDKIFKTLYLLDELNAQMPNDNP